jgi:hypothetical protein
LPLKPGVKRESGFSCRRRRKQNARFFEGIAERYYTTLEVAGMLASA